MPTLTRFLGDEETLDDEGLTVRYIWLPGRGLAERRSRPPTMPERILHAADLAQPGFASSRSLPMRSVLRSSRKIRSVRRSTSSSPARIR
jgi:hypothetical protein